MRFSAEDFMTYGANSHPFVGTLNYGSFFDVSIKNLREGINFLECPIHGIGWTFTDAVCNKKRPQKQIQEGRFYIDEKQIGFRELRKISYYVDGERLPFPKNKKSIIRTLIKGDTDDIIGRLLNEEKVLDRHFCNSGNWRFIVSFYIGYKMGKKIFGFPWMLYSIMEVQPVRLEYIHKLAVKENLCVMIPCEEGSSKLMDWDGYQVYTGGLRVCTARPNEMCENYYEKIYGKYKELLELADKLKSENAAVEIYGRHVGKGFSYAKELYLKGCISEDAFKLEEAVCHMLDNMCGDEYLMSGEGFINSKEWAECRSLIKNILNRL